MFPSRDDQLADLKLAYESFVDTAEELSADEFARSLGDWTPREILSHFVGWNRITLVGCAELREGVQPFYFYDGTNDYRKVNAGFIERFISTDREVLLEQMEFGMAALVGFLKTVNESEWEMDSGIVHYRGGAATVSRCVDSLIRDYRRHREEIMAGGGM